MQIVHVVWNLEDLVHRAMLLRTHSHSSDELTRENLGIILDTQTSNTVGI